MKLVDLGGNETMRVYCKYCKHNKWVQESNNEHRYSYYNGLESNSEYYKAICTHLNYRKVTHNPFDASGKPGNCFDINKNNEYVKPEPVKPTKYVPEVKLSLFDKFCNWLDS